MSVSDHHSALYLHSYKSSNLKYKRPQTEALPLNQLYVLTEQLLCVSLSLQSPQRPADQQIGPGLIVSIIFNVLLFIAAVTLCVLWLVSVRQARRAAGVRPPAGTEMEPLGGGPDHVPNGGAHTAEP